MIPYDPEMFPDDVTFFRKTSSTGNWGDPKRPPVWGPGTAMRASVQSRSVDRTDASGRVYTVTVHWVYTSDNPEAVTDDKFEWAGRTLVAEAATIPKGIDDVLWLTQCQETRS